MRKATVFKWPIINFFTTASRENPNTSVFSEKFVVEGTGVKLALKFRPTHQRNNSPCDRSSFFIIVKDMGGEESIVLEYRFWLENTHGEKYAEHRSKRTFERVEKGYGYLIPHNELYASGIARIKDNLLFLCCKVRPMKPDNDDDMNTSHENLRQKLWESHVKGAVGKCIIRVGEKEFPVAKNVLIAQSEVFEKMLLSDFKEGQEGIVLIEDFDARTVEAFIQFLHIETLVEPKTSAESLFALADKYDVQGLKAKCFEFLGRNLDEDNIVRCLKLAFMHDDDGLKTATMDFVTSYRIEGNFRDVLKSMEWKRLAYEHSDLTDEIIDAVFDETKWLE